jgi:hypothetical protein
MTVNGSQRQCRMASPASGPGCQRAGRGHGHVRVCASHPRHGGALIALVTSAQKISRGGHARDEGAAGAGELLAPVLLT